MKIVYWGNIKDNPHPTADSEILKALKQVAEVKFFDIKRLNVKKLVDTANQSDLFLFHGEVPTSDEVSAMIMVDSIQAILDKIECKKAMWFMEKVWLGKGRVVENLIPMVHYAFFTDETWVRRMKEEVYPLHPAAPLKRYKGNFRPEYACDIAYVGAIYGEREQEFDFLKKNFGSGVKAFGDKYGQDLADLCKSAKVMFVPTFPFDDFFWSDRVYTYLSYGGLVVQERTYGLQEEGFKDGVHYFEYQGDKELMGLMRILLAPGQEKFRSHVAKEGKRFVKEHTYLQRVEEIIKKVK